MYLYLHILHFNLILDFTNYIILLYHIIVTKYLTFNFNFIFNVQISTITYIKYISINICFSYSESICFHEFFISMCDARRVMQKACIT